MKILSCPDLEPGMRWHRLSNLCPLINIQQFGFVNKCLILGQVSHCNLTSGTLVDLHHHSNIHHLKVKPVLDSLIKGLFGLTEDDLMRSIRLKQQSQLLC